MSCFSVSITDFFFFFFFQAEDGIRDGHVTGVQTCALPICLKQRKAFTMDDAAAIMERCPSVKAIAPFKWPWVDIRVSYRDHATRGLFVFGTNEQYLTTHGYDLA